MNELKDYISFHMNEISEVLDCLCYKTFDEYYFGFSDPIDPSLLEFLGL